MVQAVSTETAAAASRYAHADFLCALLDCGGAVRSPASSGQRGPSHGVNQAHHTLEHRSDVKGVSTMVPLLFRKARQL